MIRNCKKLPRPKIFTFPAHSHLLSPFRSQKKRSPFSALPALAPYSPAKMADKKRRQSQRGGRSSGGGGGKKRRQAEPAEAVFPEEEYVPVEERDGEEYEVEQEEDEVSEEEAPSAPSSPAAKRKRNEEDDPEAIFVGSPVPVAEAHRRWPQRYKKEKIASGEIVVEEEGSVFARCHYSQAKVDGVVYKLNDTAFVQSDDDKPDYICRIIEFFEGVDNNLYFTAQWFYRPEDTIIRDGRLKGSHDPRRVFISTIKDINPLPCIVSKIKIVRISPNIDLKLKENTIPPCDFYYDMSYSVPYSTFMNLPPNSSSIDSETSSSASSEVLVEGPNGGAKSDSEESSATCRYKRSELSCLDLYSGCGGMSTGLCLGASLAGVNLVNKWAVDLNEYACQSLQLNHPETQVRNESAEDFLSLLVEWETLCSEFSLIGERACGETSIFISEDEESQEDAAGEDSSDSQEFEVEKFLGIRYGELPKSKKRGVMLKVRWKGYDESEDTWEPITGLGNCQERIKDFVRKGHKMGILPLPGEVDVICGGPPCQGISGFNRFRNYKEPLEDSKNKQMVVFMDIVHFLKPKYVLMENVVDILKFAGGFLGRYALSRLVEMNYQARLGIMAAGSYGLPQYRMRVFLWGAQPTKMLPKYPLPTHDVVTRGGSPNEFEQNVVACEENHPYSLEKKLLLEHAISDLPPVTNHEKEDEMAYKKEPSTVFQQFIRLKKHECWEGEGELLLHQTLFDHRPLCLNEDDYLRVCRIPKQKGATTALETSLMLEPQIVNIYEIKVEEVSRNLPGVVVGPNNVVEWDPNVEREYLPSKKPLVPDYAMTFVNGKSSKPFGRLWWDETVPTVVTRAEPHNQCILHPQQDRVLTIRENARLQGFPDYYQLVGPVKERYIQVGNAVAVPVARALGFSLGHAIQGIGGDDSPVTRLPQRFPLHTQSSHGNIEIVD